MAAKYTALGHNLAVLAMILAGCAAPRQAAAPAQQTYSPPGKYRQGVVVAVRQVQIAAQDGGRNGVADVLTALQTSAPAGPVAGQEVVIRLNDDSAISVMARPGTANDFAAGDRIAIADGPLAALIHSN